MRLSVEENPQLDDIEVSISCPRFDRRVQAIVAAVNALDRKLLGEADDGSTLIVPAGAVLYIETVDGRTFLYTQDTVLESRLRLYELEELLESTEFVRISKSALANFDAVQGLRPHGNGRLQLLLTNGERLVASRQYAPAIKAKIGL